MVNGCKRGKSAVLFSLRNPICEIIIMAVIMISPPRQSLGLDILGLRVSGIGLSYVFFFILRIKAMTIPIFNISIKRA